MFKDAEMWKWKMSTWSPSGIATTIQLKVMAWVSLCQGYWSFLQVKLLQLPGVVEWQLQYPAAVTLSSHTASAPGRKKGQLGPHLCMAIFSLGPDWHEPGGKGQDPGQQKGRCTMHCLWWVIVVTGSRSCALCSGICPNWITTHWFFLLSQSFLIE